MSEATIDGAADLRDANPNATVWDIVRGLSRFGAVHAMVDLRCADHLKKDGPLTTQELAARCEADPVQLGRVLRMAAALGLLTQVSPGRYGLAASDAVRGLPQFDARRGASLRRAGVVDRHERDPADRTHRSHLVHGGVRLALRLSGRTPRGQRGLQRVHAAALG